MAKDRETVKASAGPVPSKELDPAIESELRRVFGTRGFNYVPEDEPDASPVRIDVQPFRVGEFSEVSDAIVSLAIDHFVHKKRIEAILAESGKDIVRILGPYVSIPAAPSLKLEHLPFGALAGCLDLFMKGIEPGKWQLLGQGLVEKFRLGALVAALKVTPPGDIPPVQQELSPGSGTT